MGNPISAIINMCSGKKKDEVAEDFEMFDITDTDSSGLNFEELTSDPYTCKKLVLKAGEYAARYSPEVLNGVSKAADYIGDYSQKTSEFMYKGAKSESNNLTMYALATVFSAVSLMANCGKKLSEQGYNKVARTFGDFISNNLSNISTAEQYRKIACAMA